MEGHTDALANHMLTFLPGCLGQQRYHIGKALVAVTLGFRTSDFTAPAALPVTIDRAVLPSHCGASRHKRMIKAITT